MIVSIGGNDIALRPSLSTMAAVAWLSLAASDSNVENGSAFGFGHLKKLFCENLGLYVQSLVSKTKPRKVLICMIYHPCQNGDGWADSLLNLLGYRESNPVKVSRVHKLLETTFREAVCKINIPGTEIVPLQLGKVLDSKNADLYESRVEPSVAGGRVMASAFCDVIHKGLHESIVSSHNMKK